MHSFHNATTCTFSPGQQFASNPENVLEWILSGGLSIYGPDPATEHNPGSIGSVEQQNQQRMSWASRERAGQEHHASYVDSKLLMC